MERSKSCLSKASGMSVSTAKHSKKSTKYDKIKHVTDTGLNLRKLHEELDLVQKSFRFRMDEIFKRIKQSLLVSLMVETAYLLQELEELGDTTKESLADHMPYLLLDVRDVEEYQKGHMITSHHFPIARLARAMTFETPQLLAFKNAPGKVIIVYDYDELVAPQCASTLVQRGYTNVFMLSGGWKVASQLFPRGLFTRDKPRFSEEDVRSLTQKLGQLASRNTSTHVTSRNNNHQQGPRRPPFK